MNTSLKKVMAVGLGLALCAATALPAFAAGSKKSAVTKDTGAHAAARQAYTASVKQATADFQAAKKAARDEMKTALKGAKDKAAKKAARDAYTAAVKTASDTWKAAKKAAADAMKAAK